MKKVLYRIYKMGGWAFILATLIISLLKVGLPLFTISSPQFCKWASSKLQYPILIQGIKLTFDGFSPIVLLSDVQILTKNSCALHVQKINIRLSLMQLFMRKLYLEEVVMHKMVGGLDYQQGVISVKDLPLLQVNLNQMSSNVPIVRKLQIKDATLEFSVNQNHAFLANTDINIEVGSHIKMNALIKEASDEGALSETWQLMISNKITQNKFVGKLIATNVNLGKWQQRLNHIGLYPNQMKPYNLQGQIKFAAINFDEHHGELKLHSENNEVEYPFFSQPLVFKELAMLMSWQKHVNGFDFHVKALQTHLQDVPLKGEGKVSFIEEVPAIDMILEFGRTTTANILKLFPQKIMDNDLTTWLNGALSKGDHLATTCVLRGNLTEFPFDKGHGVFETVTELDNLNFNYNPPKKHQIDQSQKLPQWPPLTKVKASLHFQDRALIISSEKGNILTGELIGAQAIIPDLFVRAPQLMIDAKMTGTLSEAFKVIEESPLQTNLIKALRPLTFEGPMTLSLGLEIPLGSKTAKGIQVRGLIEVQDATILSKMWHYTPTILNLGGEVSFTQNSIKSSNLSGLLLQMPTQFTIASEGDIKITAQGVLDVDKLQQALNMNISTIQGTTEYFSELNIFPGDNFQASLTFTSSLKGIKIDAPLPFAKEHSFENPIELKAYFEPNQMMRLTGTYDEIHFTTSFILDENVQSIGAHLHFGDTRLAKFREDHVFFIDGDILNFDFPTWKTFLSQTGLLLKSQNRRSALEPLIALNVGTLSWNGLAFEKEKIEAHYEHSLNQWHATLNGPSLKGIIKIPDSETSAVLVDLQKLAIKSMNDHPFSLNKTPNTQAIDIKVKELIWGNKLISHIQARLEPSWKGYFFSNVLAKMKDTDVILSGNWDYLSGENKVSTTGKIVINNISETLNALGLKGTVQKGKGVVDFDLNWQGTPSKIDYATLAGQAEFALSDGIIQGMNPGIGRVLSLLNLDNVKRRLNLDFSDVTKDGFSFNELNGKFQFGKGKVSSNKVHLDGPSAKIEAFGQVDLENQGLEGEMIVMPNVTGSLPVAAAIAAGNPAVGAAFWAVDKMFGHKIQEIHRVRYKVQGTWETPKVEEVLLQVKGLPFEMQREG